jgi:hypothetical protein
VTSSWLLYKMPRDGKLSGGNHVGRFYQHRGAAGGGFRAYLAVPESESGPGLVLFHDISDDDRDLRELERRLAATLAADVKPPWVVSLVRDG